MKKNDDNIIKFKDLADKIKSISDGTADEDDFDIDAFIESGIAKMFTDMLSESLSEPFEPATDEEIYEEITDYFFLLINLLGIEKFSFFRFADYDCCDVIIIDGKKYDLDGEFSHNDEAATGALCAIDCLIADLCEDIEEDVLKKVEGMINIRNRKEN